MDYKGRTEGWTTIVMTDKRWLIKDKYRKLRGTGLQEVRASWSYSEDEEDGWRWTGMVDCQESDVLMNVKMIHCVKCYIHLQQSQWTARCLLSLCQVLQRVTSVTRSYKCYKELPGCTCSAGFCLWNVAALSSPPVKTFFFFLLQSLRWVWGWSLALMWWASGCNQLPIFSLVLVATDVIWG